MIPIQNQKSVSPANFPTSLSDGFKSEGFLRLVERDEQGAFPAGVGEILRSVNRILRQLDNAEATMSPKKWCFLLGTLDCHVFSLRLAADEMESTGHPNALLLSVLAAEAESRADAEAHVMLRSLHNTN